MIGSLRGTVLDRMIKSDHLAEVLLEVGGVGYRVLVPAGSAAAHGELGSAAFFHIHTHVREDALLLYGFATLDERVCFEALIGAHGVGPAVALTMLSVHSPSALRRAVASEDHEVLMLVPGIGRKIAARLLIELKSRLGDGDGDLSVASVGGRQGSGDARSEVRVALAGLGYTPEEVRQIVAGLPNEGSVEELIRHALRDLAAAR